MKAYLGIGLVLLIISAAVGGYIHSQDARLRAADATIAEQGESIGALSAANAAQAATITELRDSKERDDALVAGTAEKLDKLATRIQSLDRRTQEALRNAPNLTIDSLLPPDAADALCLQWHEAGGRITPDHPGNASPGADARAGDTASAGRGTASGSPDCSGWRKMTVRNAVEWNGLLLRHAGLEREDKAALRAWAAKGGR